MATERIVAKGLDVEKYEFVDSNGEYLFTVPLNTTDLDIVRRYESVVEWLNNIQVDTNATDEESTKAMLEISDQLKEQIDFMFGTKVSAEVFRVNPFSPMENGDLYVYVALDNIAALIETKMNARIKKAEKRMKKHTDKYTQKYHN